MKKTVLLPLLALLAVPALAADAPAPVVSQDFEAQVPGETPEKWKVIWGQQGDDQLTVSNVKALSGEKSVLIDRQSGTSLTQYGVGRSFADVKSDWCVISFGVLTEGEGSNIGLSVEIRNAASKTETKVINLNLKGSKVGVSSGDYKTKAALGDLPSGQWGRFTLWLPTAGGAQTNAYATLETKAADGKWQPVGKPQTLPAAPPEGGYGSILFNLPPNQRNFKIFIDDFTVTQKTTAPTTN